MSVTWPLTALTLLVMAHAFAARARMRRETAVAMAQLELRICDLQRRSRETELLFDMSQLLHLGNGAVQIHDVVTLFGPRLFPLHDGAMYVADPAGGAAELAAWWGTRPADTCPGEIPGRLRMPMVAFGEQIGVLTLESTPEETASMEVVAAFADQLAGALATSRMQETLKTRAIRDSLTGLFNRRYLEETLSAELQRCRLSGGCVSLILIDIDRFKNINDTFGHAGGDALLQQFARLLQQFFRDSDVVCRCGGEEFVVLLPETQLSTAIAWANRLRVQLRGLEPHLGDRMLGPVTMSAGVATAPHDGVDPEALLAAADRALYLAKNGGRDRVIAAAPGDLAA